MGSYLCELTDELGGDIILVFVSAGPKCYANQTGKGKSVLHAKGITQTRQCGQKVNCNNGGEMGGRGHRHTSSEYSRRARQEACPGRRSWLGP